MLKRFLGFLNFCLIATLSFYYLQLCGLSVKEFFAVSPQVFILAFCFLLLFAGESFMRAFVIPALLYYGVTGLFFYPWTGVDIANQAVHVLLLMNALYFLMALALGFKIIALSLGVAAGLAACAGLRFYQTAFLQKEKHLAKKYLPEDMRPPEKKKKHPKKNLRSMMSVNERWKLND
ncbi:MAG: hypothetical protein J7M11_05225 [Elusimicrobia bacterium]|nr:hypothetical protein [Elusimicrobiota bacterium]